VDHGLPGTPAQPERELAGYPDSLGEGQGQLSIKAHR
jgi:hypothetical protein